MSCKFCGPANPDCPEPVEDMALTGASMLIGAGFPPGMTMGAAYRMLQAAKFELTLPPTPYEFKTSWPPKTDHEPVYPALYERTRTMLDHEPGTDCPNSPNTCITCEPKRAAAENAVVRFNATYPGLRARLGGSSQDKSFSPDSPDFEGGHK